MSYILTLFPFYWKRKLRQIKQSFPRPHSSGTYQGVESQSQILYTMAWWIYLQIEFFFKGRKIFNSNDYADFTLNLRLQSHQFSILPGLPPSFPQHVCFSTLWDDFIFSPSWTFTPVLSLSPSNLAHIYLKKMPWEPLHPLPSNVPTTASIPVLSASTSVTVEDNPPLLSKKIPPMLLYIPYLLTF